MVVRPLVRRLIVAGRLVNFSFFLLTATFCLLASSPFANEQFLKPHISTWLTNFVVFHTDFYWLALSITALTLAPFLDRSPAKPIGWAYLALSAAIGLWLATHTVMPDVGAPRHALALAVAAFIPPVFLALFDHAAHPFPDIRPLRSDGRLLYSCASAAVFCWLTFSLQAPLRLSIGGLTIGLRDWSSGAALAALVQTAAFSGLFVVFVMVGAAASATGIGSIGEFVLLGALAVLTGAMLIVKLILVPIAITGAGAWLVAGTGALSSVLVASGIARQCWQGADHRGDVVDLWCTPLRVRAFTSSVILLLLLPPVAFAALGRVSMFDWDFMFQKLIAIALSVSAFALIHSGLLTSGGSGVRVPKVLASAVGVLVCTTTTLGAATLLRASDANSRTATYIAADPSLRLARDLLARRDESSVGFYAYLRANTGLAVPIAPVPIDFVRSFAPAAAPPHVFLFVIDSLRPDYLSTYNPAVTFTPGFDAFARDGVVFERAFSRYGGTGLAVPSIWAGGLLPHKEYVTPFAPMNALAKLLGAYKYRRFTTFSHITEALFPRSDDTVELARTVPEMRHTLCGTLEELEVKLKNTPRDGKPIFGYTRSLDLHIGNVWSARPEPGESYAGFHAAYASRVHRMDACLARFIEYLRSDGLYDNSVIIVTADHGDSLGEGLRWGHGFTVFPEVIRVPMIVHLPRRLSDEYTADVHRVAFTVDLVPTLYTLLGQQPTTAEPLQGSPLFVRSRGNLTDRRTVPFLVVSSYGPTYGVLSRNGTRLYIADGINGREYLFDLTTSLAGRPVGITDEERAASRRVIQEQIAAIAAAYRYASPPAIAQR